MDQAQASVGVSELAETKAAAADVCRQVKEQLTTVDLAVVFASFQHQLAFDVLAEVIARELGATCLLGCTGESIVGGAREIEGSPAVALWAARLPGTTLLPMRLEFQATPDGGTFTGWHESLFESWPDAATLLLLAEPFSFPADVLLARLNQDQPGTQVVGGMASGGWHPNQNRLVWNGQTLDRGAVGVLLHERATRVRTVVSQGCRPIGRSFVVTKAERNVIYELGGRPALEQLQEVFGTLTPEEQGLARQGLHVGQVINEYQDQFSRGDFLVRNVQGADSETGAIAIGDYVRTGQTVQFHVRDAATADEDLTALVTSADPTSHGAFGALLFTCNGRGSRLFDAPDHDAAVLARHSGSLPAAGFFAQGEIGPIGGKNFLHGFTASIALFERAEKTDDG